MEYLLAIKKIRDGNGKSPFVTGREGCEYGSDL
jgi:hypothetical protein